MKMIKALSIAAVLALSTAAGAADKSADKGADKGQAKAAADQDVTVLVLVPVDMSKSLGNGCWAQLFDKRDFKGDAFTMVGPLELESADKAAGRTLHRNIDSLVVGPKATLTVYEHKLFKDKSVKFAPNAKEAGLIKRLGFTGRIESVKLECGS